ncbi:alpha/beta fold hydrolase [Antarcticirhabdus aurantiaca]|uniref:Alpha/beta hydrolase n=1 Tax=Antarcticirhabdus aurantiaca TaxID=2606717 RepID=A0ACD4NM76_9HYPH|nr:alpha/beta hydrolase [Antarcticirhabdus aurantiaca]WAJ27736.1 alpha/beta hydrolase [Jeongeuplla avenae]
MFEGFEERFVDGDGAAIFCRIAGSGPPLLLLHGYPQTGAMWAEAAVRLAGHFTVVVADLRGYGRSDTPRDREKRNHSSYSKRAMARDMVAVMSHLGHRVFHACGHDRGARVAYRMALDYPERVGRLALLDILPTVEVWDAMDANAAIKSYHWPFLAQPEPLPETLIAADPVYYLEHTLRSWTKRKDLSAFSNDALDDYRAAFRQKGHIHAACEDYRAGATIDREIDEEDRAAHRRIQAPTFVIWGADYGVAKGGDPLAIWRRWCDSVEGAAVDAGHFLVEEAPEETLKHLLGFFVPSMADDEDEGG